MTDQTTRNRQAIRWLMLAVFIWGGTLALGAFLFGLDMESREVTLAPNPLRGLIVLSCVGSFLGLWALLLRSRYARENRQADALPDEETQASHKNP